jgi:hypothetical protein
LASGGAREGRHDAAKNSSALLRHDASPSSPLCKCNGVEAAILKVARGLVATRLLDFLGFEEFGRDCEGGGSPICRRSARAIRLCRTRSSSEGRRASRRAVICLGWTTSDGIDAQHRFDVDQPGKDSHEYRTAGARVPLFAQGWCQGPSCLISWSQPGPAGGLSTSTGLQGAMKPGGGLRRKRGEVNATTHDACNGKRQGAREAATSRRLSRCQIDQLSASICAVVVIAASVMPNKARPSTAWTRVS